MESYNIVKIKGGFGNQLFIYAFAKAVEQKYGQKILFDEIEFLNAMQALEEKNQCFCHYTKKTFSLFGFELNYADESQIKTLKKIKRLQFPKFLRRLFNLPNFVENILSEEQPFVFNDVFLKKYENIFYDGYFQNERYFKSVEHIIRKQFVFPEFLETDSFNFNLAQKIKACAEPVFVHVRRGDYCDLGLDLPIEYYRKACAYIKNKIPEAEFFVFSDDAEHIKKSFDIGYDFAAVDGVNFANKEDYKDMHLMSLCRHAVIANSSFSWWGAWLINNRDKIVAAPYPWIKFKSEKQSKNSSSIICDDWIKIEANENRKVI